ncbi:MAG: hypothetical protein QHH19_01455 [Candidatus Thermoplasmatota archaeon]|jgi:peptidoglycan/LPS O-acetylase OafA/YrhL|nr:hypothetical protein [Candidatus Thermoplasmatota archaeon]
MDKEEKPCCEDAEEKTDVGWRPSFSIIVGVGWLVFIILWLAFYADDYAWEKNLAIILLSIFIMFLLLGGVWTIWGIRKIPKEGWEMFKTSGFKSRVIASIILPIVSMLFLIIWFWYYAEQYTVYQNRAVFIAVLLIIGGVLGALWARWGVKHREEFKKNTKITKKE